LTTAFNHLPSSDSQALFGNCALVQSCILPKWLVCVCIHLACWKMNCYMVDFLRMTPCVSKCIGVA